MPEQPPQIENGHRDEMPVHTTAVKQESDLNPDERERWEQAMASLREASQQLKDLRSMLQAEDPSIQDNRKIFMDVQERYDLRIDNLIDPSDEKHDESAPYRHRTLYEFIKEQTQTLESGQWFQYAQRRTGKSWFKNYGFLTGSALTELGSTLGHSMRALPLINTFFRHRPEQQALWEPIVIKLNQIDRAVRQLLTHMGVTPHTPEEIHFGEDWYPDANEQQYISANDPYPAWIVKLPEVQEWLSAPERHKGKHYVIDVNNWGGKITFGPEKDTHFRTPITYGLARK